MGLFGITWVFMGVNGFCCHLWLMKPADFRGLQQANCARSVATKWENVGDFRAHPHLSSLPLPQGRGTHGTPAFLNPSPPVGRRGSLDGRHVFVLSSSPRTRGPRKPNQAIHNSMHEKGRSYLHSGKQTKRHAVHRYDESPYAPRLGAQARNGIRLHTEIRCDTVGLHGTFR